VRVPVTYRSGVNLNGLWRQIDVAFTALLLIGVFVALGGSRTGAWLLLAALAGLVAGHLAISVVSYRRTMSRPWPAVQPLHDDPLWDD